jgi:HK97 family phage prohead protease
MNRLRVELKEVGEDGTFAGVASVYGVEDLGGDVIDKGAFSKSISENPTIPILWQHKNDEVIGTGNVSEWQGKVLLKGSLDLEDPTAAKAYRKLKSGLIRGLSIGFTTVKSAWAEVEGRSIRHIQELKLWEVSIVTFPMLPAAQVTRVKEAEDVAARLSRLEQQISTLAAANGTPLEPPKASEPQMSAEPVADHSKLAALVQSISETIPKE